MRKNLWTDPRVGVVCDRTEAREATVIGALFWLWSLADEHSSDGALCMSASSIDRHTGLAGFCAALAGIGWIAVTDEGVQITRFEEHNGASAKARAQMAKRVATNRANARRNASNDTKAIQEADKNDTGALARKEKKRERKEEEETSPAALPAAPAPSSEPKKAKKKGPMPEGFCVSERVEAWAKEKGFSNLSGHLDAFKRKVAANGYTYADWDAAFMEAVREDWAKLRGGRVAPPPDDVGNIAHRETQRMLAERDAQEPADPKKVAEALSRLGDIGRRMRIGGGQ